MLRRSLLFVCLLASGSVVCASTEKLALFLQGKRIGEMSITTRKERLNGQISNRSDSKTVITTEMLGSEMRMVMTSSTWTNDAGSPLKMSFVTDSAGRKQTVVATFGSKFATLLINSQGAKTTKRLQIPAGAPLTDDPLVALLSNPKKQSSEYYVLDPTSASFIKNKISIKGNGQAVISGNKFDAKLIEIVDPRVTTTIYVDAKNNLLKVDGPLGMEMFPEKLAPKNSEGPVPDLASISSLPVDGDLPPATQLSRLKLKVTGKDLSSVPSDEGQTVNASGDSAEVDIHPVKLLPASESTIAAAANAKDTWTKASMDMPSDSPTFINLASKIIGKETKVEPAALAIKHYVQQSMHPNAGIGVVRDAGEVLKTKEGVCRDYAILTTTLLRAAHIPARLATGLVAYEGKFYYHAWSEYFDGAKWVGLDSTLPADQLHAGHFKLAQGNVEDAYIFVLLEKVKFKVESFEVSIK